MELIPIHNYVMVKRSDAPKSNAGIYITGTEKINEGEVLEVGPGIKNEDGTFQGMDVKVGDKIMFTESAAKAVKSLGIEYLILKETDILGILE